ncbi:MAG: type II secretion system protein [Candidatus Komeilibacteria bacterium]|jgi:prepilin-type N-terminal cleavage/methylation domain-containing protein|nr:type II secretion system protein [Candidatus Komeilibacteria bacterium]MBT4447392.1 type II secretion system protein [Candidatus Komeilibacteria bacterium]
MKKFCCSNYLKITQEAFTLVELLVVIAIIGILSTAAVVNFNTTREKAKVAGAKAWGSALKPAVIFCDSQGSILTDPMNTPTVYGGGGALCMPDVGVDWPTEMPEGYNRINVLSNGQGLWVFEIRTFNVTPLLPEVICNNFEGCAG